MNNWIYLRGTFCFVYVNDSTLSKGQEVRKRFALRKSRQCRYFEPYWILSFFFLNGTVRVKSVRTTDATTIQHLDKLRNHAALTPRYIKRRRRRRRRRLSACPREKIISTSRRSSWNRRDLERVPKKLRYEADVALPHVATQGLLYSFNIRHHVPILSSLTNNVVGKLLSDSMYTLMTCLSINDCLLILIASSWREHYFTKNFQIRFFYETLFFDLESWRITFLKN